MMLTAHVQKNKGNGPDHLRGFFLQQVLCIVFMMMNNMAASPQVELISCPAKLFGAHETTPRAKLPRKMATVLQTIK